MKILLTGGNGRLGTELRHLIPSIVAPGSAEGVGHDLGGRVHLVDEPLQVGERGGEIARRDERVGMIITQNAAARRPYFPLKDFGF